MAQETLSVQVSGRAGLKLNEQSITTANGFRFANDGKTLLIIQNDAGDLVVTITPTKKVDGLTPAARSVTITAAEQWTLGPWQPDIYNDPDGYAEFTVDVDLATATAAVSLAVSS